MTVKELIEELQKLPPDAIIYTRSDVNEWGREYDATEEKIEFVVEHDEKFWNWKGKQEVKHVPNHVIIC